MDMPQTDLQQCDAIVSILTKISEECFHDPVESMKP